MAEDEFSKGTTEKIEAMHEILNKMYPVLTSDLPLMKELLSTVAEAQSKMAHAAASMAETNKRAETRYERLEDRLQDANDRASGKSQMPILSHYLILGGTVFMTILVVLYVHNQTVDATLTSIKVNQAGTK